MVSSSISYLADSESRMSAAGVALSRFLRNDASHTLDRVTRKFLVFAWACECPDFSTAALDQICQAADLNSPSINAADFALTDWFGLCRELEVYCALSSLIFERDPASRMISLEGGDGSGKTSQAAALAARLNNAGICAVSTRALGGSGGPGLMLRAFLLDPQYSWSPKAEALLTISIYREAMISDIFPALRAGKVVVCDRLIDTLSVYLCNEELGLTPAVYERLFDILVSDHQPGLRPDLTFILDLTYEQALARRLARDPGKPDRNEAKGEVFHRRVFSSYRQLASTDSRFCLIDASGDADAITEIMAGHVITSLSHHEEFAYV